MQPCSYFCFEETFIILYPAFCMVEPWEAFGSLSLSPWITPGDGKLRVVKHPWWWNHIIRTPWNIEIPSSQIFNGSKTKQLSDVKFPAESIGAIFSSITSTQKKFLFWNLHRNFRNFQKLVDSVRICYESIDLINTSRVVSLPHPESHHSPSYAGWKLHP